MLLDLWDYKSLTSQPLNLGFLLLEANSILIGQFIIDINNVIYHSNRNTFESVRNHY